MGAELDVTPDLKAHYYMFGSILASLAGSATKVAIAASVTAASVGGAYASDAIDLPILPDEESSLATDSVPQSAIEIVLVEEPTAAEQGDAPAAADLEEETEAAEETEETDGSEESDAAEDTDEAPNHGSEVSKFVHETDLQGCEKGHAVAALASGKAEKADKECGNNKKSSDPEDKSDDDDSDDDSDDDQALESKTEKDKTKKDKRPNRGRGSKNNS